MDKLWVIAFKDIRTRFTDRTLLLIMIAAPIAISTIIGLAFGGLGRTTSPIQHIPVAVINNDQPLADGTSFGTIMAGLLTTGELPAGMNTSLAACPQNSAQSNAGSNKNNTSLAELINGTTFDKSVAQQLVANNKIAAPAVPVDSPDYLKLAAQAAVDKDIYNALVIIPADFSTVLNSQADPRKSQTATMISVYGNAGEEISAGIVRSVVDSITAKMNGENVAMGATITELAKRQPAVLRSISNQKLSNLFICAFSSGNDLIQLANIPVQAAPTSTAGTLLVTFGSAQALFFALFTGQNGILSMYDERRNGTLQRLLVSPTPRWTVLGGKLIGVLVSVLFQLIILAIALTLVGSIIEGRFVFIWGSNLIMLGLLLLSIAIAVSGLGMFLAGILKGIEQANIVGSMLNMALGVLGGAFGFQLARSVAQFSLVYWARNAFDLLAAGRGDISLNILVLFVEGAVLFGIGLLLFNRRFEV
jgi:ABC-2 type transport system permease protein